VNPFWPLLALMLGGSWLGLTWFVLNGWAMGSARKMRELGIAAIGIAGSVVIVLAIVLAAGAGALPKSALPYALLVATVWKLGVGYVLFRLQTQTFGLYEYYGGPVSNGIFVALAGAFLAPRVEAALSDSALGRLLLLVLG
jgi:hypothetical protein